jgi:hypothetical protein
MVVVFNVPVAMVFVAVAVGILGEARFASSLVVDVVWLLKDVLKVMVIEVVGVSC